MRRGTSNRRAGWLRALVGMILGIAFLVYGVFKVLPVNGANSILWILLSVFIITVNYRSFANEMKNSSSKASDDELDVGRYEEQNEGTGTNHDDGPVEKRLMALYRRYNRKELSKDEYMSERKKVLDEIDKELKKDVENL